VRILIASTPAAGHLNPLLAIGRILIAEGHEIVGLSGSALRERIESIGAKFRPLPAGADFRDIVVPELKNMPPGLQWLRVAMERLLVDTIPAQHNGLEQVWRDFAADVIIGDDMFSACCRSYSGLARKGPRLCFVVRRFCTGAAKTGRRIFLACHRQPPRRNSGNTRLFLKNMTGSSISYWPVV
jgi:UDP:flavonoid glycosyltransferase YjiC (YdhE family)